MRHYGPEDLVGIVLTPKETESDGLERKMGLFSVIIISLSAMIGSGLFVLPALAITASRFTSSAGALQAY